MRAVDEDGFGEVGFGEELLGLGDVGGRVVGAGGAAAKDDVAIGIAAGDDGGGGAVEVDAEEGLGLGGGLDGVDRGGDGAVGAVFETERHREAGGHLAVGLRFGGAGADGGPADEVGDVLWGDGVEKFGGGGQAEVEDVAEECAGEPEAVGDVVGAVEMRVHHESLPADGGARFFEIDAHDDHHAVGNFLGEGGEASGVVAAGVEVVDRARSDDEEETFIVGEDESLDFAAGVGDEGGLRFGFRDFGEERGGRGKGAGFDDVDVGCSLHEWSGELGTWERRGASFASEGSEEAPSSKIQDPEKIQCSKTRASLWRKRKRRGRWGSGNLGKKSGGPLTPKRPAFAFLVTPKLPLGGRSVEIDELRSSPERPTVNSKFENFCRASGTDAINVSSASEVLTGANEFFVWKPAAWLRVTGADALSFLQGQFTNDLRGLGEAGAVYGLWLNHKGRVLADSFVVRGGGAEEIWVGSYFSDAAAIRERLEAYVIADDVVVEDVTAARTGVTLFRAGNENAAGVGVRFPGRRASESCVEWVLPAEVVEEEVRRWAGARELSADEMERRRIEAAIPAVPRDIGPGELPNEGGLETTAISYNKGCYLGQEVMARLKSMGQVRRRLVRVRGNGETPGVPADLFQGERKVGELRSVVRSGDGFVGLALVSLLNVRKEAGLAWAEGGAEVVSWFPGEWET